MTKNKLIFISIVFSLVLCGICYLTENIPFAFGESLWRFFFAERAIQKRSRTKTDVLDDGFFINVGYDKAIAEIDLYHNLFKGRVAITDRKTLDDILARLEYDDTYKYIFLDVRFEAGIKTPQDSALFHRIARMRDIVIATHHDTKLASPILVEKAAISDFKTTISSTGFSRYQFLQNKQKTVPLRIYEDVTGKTIKQFGVLPIYYYSRPFTLCNNSLFIRFPEDFSKKFTPKKHSLVDKNTSSNQQLYYDCGLDIDADFPLKEMVSGKYVVIGDFIDDNAGTYMGEQPNPYIAFLATKSLLNGQHNIKLLFMGFLVLFFGCLCYLIISKKDSSITNYALGIFSKRLNIKIKESSKLGVIIKWGRAFISYYVDLFIVCLFLFLVFGITFSIFFPSLAFSILTTVTDDAA